MLIKKANVTATYKKQETRLKHWKNFCQLFDLDHILDHHQISYIFYASWRFKTTPNKANSISDEISQIISIYNNLRLDDNIDRSKFTLLKKLFRGMRRIKGREPQDTNPVRNSLLVIMIKRYETEAYHHILYRTMMVFAKKFALRCSEHSNKTRKPTINTLHWNQLTFISYKSALFLQYNLKETKTNKENKYVVLSKRCSCNIDRNICVVHSMLLYKMIYRKIHGKFEYVFRHKNGSLVTCFEFRRALDAAFIYAGITPKYPFWRAHSLRHGEIADLKAAGVDWNTIQKFARHVPGSKSTQLYTNTESHEDANIIYDQFVNFNSRLYN